MTPVMKNKITLIRQYHDEKSLFGTISIHLKNGNYTSFATVENNGKHIEKGTYNIYHSYSPKFDTNLWTIHVDDRTGIRVHSANIGTELSGCIALGLFKLDDRIYQSKKAINIFHTLLNKYETYQIEII